MPATQSPVVFAVSLMLVAAVALPGWFMPEQFGTATQEVYSLFSANLGWWYLLAMNIFVIFPIMLALSRYGSLRLGRDEEKPEFSTPVWLGMLFAVGQGVGLVFYGVGEPLTHFSLLPYGAPAGSAQAAQDALRGTFVHWGLHPWGGYSVIALCLAFFQYRKGAPALMSSLLLPLLGPNAHHTVWGKVVNVAAIFATVGGVVTSLGLAVMQLSSGLQHVFHIPDGPLSRMGIILSLGSLFLLCGLLGLDKGIKRLSNLNMTIYISLGLLVFIFGPSLVIIESFITGLGVYLGTIVQESFAAAPFGGNYKAWAKDWTVYYWGWWIAWAPFVGAFVARISRGRTIREFVAGVLLLPSLGCFLWIAIFGGTGLWMQLAGVADLAASVQGNIATGIYTMYEHLTLGNIMALLTLALLFCLFVTSGSSCSFVLAMYSTNGNPNPSKLFLVVWSATLSALVAVLLLNGGLRALQAISLVAAAPFSCIMVLACACLYSALRQESTTAANPPD